VMGAGPVKSLIARGLGLVDSPLLSRVSWRGVLRRSGAEIATPERLSKLDEAGRQQSVIVVQDAFTRYFETPVAAAFLELAARLGFKVFVAPYLPNGKPLHVQGFLPKFRRAARRNAAQLAALARTGVPLVGIDPAMTLVYRQEYRKVEGIEAVPDVQLPQEWLIGALRTRAISPRASGSFSLLPHCTERTNASAAALLWKDVFATAGLTLATPASGCCGMSGTYGHEARNRATSETIFEQSWARHVDGASTSTQGAQELLATGYSCRCQVKRLRGRQLRHPIQALLDALR